MLKLFDTAEGQVALADRATPALVRAVAATSERMGSLARQGKTGRLDSLVANEAWTEAALELLSLGAPEWSLGRLCRIDGSWLCTLTRHPDVPDWLDDSIEHTHRSLQLALIGAVLEALQQRKSSNAAAPAHGHDQTLDVTDYR